MGICVWGLSESVEGGEYIEKNIFQCLYSYHGINQCANVDVEDGGG